MTWIAARDTARSAEETQGRPEFREPLGRAGRALPGPGAAIPVQRFDPGPGSPAADLGDRLLQANLAASMRAFAEEFDSAAAEPGADSGSAFDPGPLLPAAR